jgi:hypothetical protein
MSITTTTYTVGDPVGTPDLSTYTISTINTIDTISPYPYLTTGSNHDFRVNGALVVNGIDVEERLSIIEKALGIPERDPELEEKHPKLKEMYDAYITALAKYRTWKAVSK